MTLNWVRWIHFLHAPEHPENIFELNSWITNPKHCSQILEIHTFYRDNKSLINFTIFISSPTASWGFPRRKIIIVIFGVSIRYVAIMLWCVCCVCVCVYICDLQEENRRNVHVTSIWKYSMSCERARDRIRLHINRTRSVCMCRFEWKLVFCQ